MKLHPCPLLLLICFTFSSSIWNWCYGKLMGKAMHFPWGRIYHRMEIWWKKVPILWGKYGYQFPRLSQFDGFRCIFQCYGKLMGIWLVKCTHTMGKACVPISQAFASVLLNFPVLCETDGETHAFPIMIKYTIGWELDRKKLPIFPCFPHTMGFVAFSRTVENWWENLFISHYDELYHRMGIGWEKSIHTMGKVWLPISHFLPISWVLLHFPMLWEIDGKTQAFPIWWDSLFFSCDKWISNLIFP